MKITHPEICIFRGDPNRGNDGFMFSVRIGAYYYKSIGCYKSRTAAATAAADHIDELEQHGVPTP